MVGVRGESSKHATVVGADPTGLGRWNHTDMINNDIKVRVMSACQRVKSKQTLGTVHLQRRRCFRARDIHECPRKLFILHLPQLVFDSISSGLEVILTVDVNEHVAKGKLAQQLNALGLREAYCTKFNSEGGPAQCFRCRH